MCGYIRYYIVLFIYNIILGEQHRINFIDSINAFDLSYTNYRIFYATDNLFGSDRVDQLNHQQFKRVQYIRGLIGFIVLRISVGIRRIMYAEYFRLLNLLSFHTYSCTARCIRFFTDIKHNIYITLIAHNYRVRDSYYISSCDFDLAA